MANHADLWKAIGQHAGGLARVVGRAVVNDAKFELVADFGQNVENLDDVVLELTVCVVDGQ